MSSYNKRKDNHTDRKSTDETGTPDETGADEAVEAYSWPVSRLGEALEILAVESSLKPRSVDIPAPPQGLGQFGITGHNGCEALGRWIETAASCLGLEAEPVQMSYAQTERLLRHAGPALVLLPAPGQCTLSGPTSRPSEKPSACCISPGA